MDTSPWDAHRGAPRPPGGPTAALLTATPGRPVGLVAALFGREVVDRDGTVLGRVEDLVLEPRDELDLTVVGIALRRGGTTRRLALVGDPVDAAEGPAHPTDPPVDARAARRGDQRLLLTELLGSEVLDSRGSTLGVVTEVDAAAVEVAGRTELRVVSITHGGRVVLVWHRRAQVTPWSDVLALPDADDRTVWVRTAPRMGDGSPG